MTAELSLKANTEKEICDIYPLSPMQREILFFCLLSGDPASYFEQLSMRLVGEFNTELFIKSLSVISERHNIFKTVFVYEKLREPVQVVLKKMALEWDQEDIEELDEIDRIQLIQDFEKRDRARGFDFVKGPLMRLKIFKLGGNRHHLIWSYHHILGDGWTFGALLNELVNDVYAKYLKNEVVVIDHRPPQFSTYIRWLMNQDVGVARDYWRFRLEGFSQLTSLRIEGVRSAGQNAYSLREKTCLLSREISNNIQSLSRDYSVTLNIVFLSIWGILLSRYNNCSDVVFGSVISGRPAEISGIESMFGLFINTIPIRVSYNEDTTFRNLLKDCQREFLDSESKSYLPLSEITSLSQLRARLLDHIIIFENYPLQSQILDQSLINRVGFQMQDMKIHEKTNLDLNLIVYPGERMSIRFNYNGEIYEDAALDLIIQHFENLVEDVYRNQDAFVKDLSIVNRSEYDSMMDSLNDTGRIYEHEVSLASLIEAQVDKNPVATAIIGTDRNLTYADLDKEGNRIAHFLKNVVKVDYEDRIGILVDRSELMLVAQLGILKSGACYVPIDPEWPRERVASIIVDASIKCMVISKRHVGVCNRLQWDCGLNFFLCLDSDDVLFEPEDEPNKLMNLELWEYYSRKGAGDIESGGWINSYNGSPFSEKEMQEFANNVILKIGPYLNNKTKVLEIGCGSALTTFALAPRIGTILATDLSESILFRNRERGVREGINNVTFIHAVADEIDTIDEITQNHYDVIILNSVIQYFPGLNYLRRVIAKLLKLSRDGSILFLGDLMDQDLKRELVASTLEYVNKNRNGRQLTKLDWSNELFISKDFLLDLSSDFPDLAPLSIGNKIYTIPNELTKYRFDAVFQINRRSRNRASRTKTREQYDRQTLHLHTYDRPKNIRISGNHLAYIIYTSGSTGKPKGVMISQGAVHNFIVSMLDKIPFARGEKILCVTTIAFDIYVLETLAALAAGMAVVIADLHAQRNPGEILRLIDRHGIEMIQSTPSRYQMLLLDSNTNRSWLRKLKVIMIGGEAVTPSLVKEIKNCTNAQIWNMYGPTETTVWSTVARLDTVDEVNIGKPIANTKVIILNKFGHPQPAGVPGELWIGGDGLARGYMNLPELTASRFVKIVSAKNELYYNTGDLAFWHTRGHLEYLGRIDHQVKVRGFRVELGEIEEVLRSFPYIQHVAVLAMPGADEETILVAYYTSDSMENSDQIREYCRIRLPSYMIPSAWVSLDTMPLNTSGKINRSSLESMGYATLSRKPGKNPETTLEKKLHDIWSQLFDKSQVFIDDNFFDIGGHSLLAMSMITRLKGEFAGSLTINDVFENPTIELLAKRLEKFSAASPQSSLTRVDDRASCLMTPAQKRLFILRYIEGDNTAYNLSWAAFLQGPFDQERFRLAVEKLSVRYDILRTSFHLIGETPVQKIEKNAPIPLEFSSIPADSSEFCDLEATLRLEAFVRTFDLGQAPLIRMRVEKIDDQNHLLLLDIHHMVADGLSMQILFDILFRLYAGETLDSLPFQFADYAEWLNQQSKSREYEEAKNYWMDQFSGEIPILDMPLDFHRPDKQDFRGDSVDFPIDLRSSAKLIEIAKSNMVTPAVSYMALFALLLSKFTGQRKIVIGSPSESRLLEETRSMIGMFVNVLPIIIDCDPSLTFTELLQAVRSRITDGLNHQIFPFEDLVESLTVPRDTGRNPLFDTMFIIQDVPDNLEIGGLRIKPVHVKSTVAKFDLTGYLFLTGDGPVFRIEYATSLFKRETVDLLGTLFLNLCSNIAETPEQTVGIIRLTDWGRESRPQEGKVKSQIQILDSQGNMQPDGVPGELCIAGIRKGLGYGDRGNADLFFVSPLLNNEVVFRTGEWGRFLPTGEIEILGLPGYRKQTRSLPVTMTPHSLPETKIDPDLLNKITSVWKEALCLEKIDPNDNFFSLGGHSFLAIRMVSALRDEGIDVDVSDLFSNPTIYGFAKKIAGSADGQRTGCSDDIIAELRRQKGMESRIDDIKLQNASLRVMTLNSSFAETLDQQGVWDFCVSRLEPDLLPDRICVVDDLNALRSVDDLIGFVTQDLNLKRDDGSGIALQAVVLDRFLEADEKFRNIVENDRPERIFPLSAFQKIQAGADQRFGGTVLLFNSIASSSVFLNACRQVIEEQGLIRSAVVRKDGEIFFEQYSFHEMPDIPLVDLSAYPIDIQIQMGKQIGKFAFMIGGDIDQQGPLFRWCALKLTLKRYVLICGFDHLVFDGFSAELIRSRITEICSGGDKNNTKISEHNYDTYVKIVSEVDPALSDIDVIKGLRLNEFHMAEKKFSLMCKSRLPEGVYERFSIPFVPENGGGEELLMAKSLLAVCRVWSECTGISTVPVRMITNSRYYRGYSFHDIVGEFLDIIPLTVSVSDGADLVRNQVETILKFCRSTGINCLSLSLSPELGKKWSQAASILQDINPSNRFLWFNFLGKVQSMEYDIANQFLALEKMETSRQQNDLFVEVKYDSQNLYFFVGRAFDFGIKSIQRSFVDAIQR
jgi:amino acid adenylation domain-containing protein